MTRKSCAMSVPGASWSDAVAPCLVTGLILAGLGWGLDTIFKPRLSTPAPDAHRQAVTGA